MRRRVIVLGFVLALVAAACGTAEEVAEEAAEEVAEVAEETAEEMVEEEVIVEDSTDPIVIPLHNWSSQIAGAYVVGGILEATGATVKYVTTDSRAVYQSVCEGDIHLVHAVWEGSVGVNFEATVGEGCVEDVRTHTATTREEWWYPTYVQEFCPGLPDWMALQNADCIAALATPESGGHGVYSGGPAEWQRKDPERIAALGLDMVVINAGTVAAIWAVLDSAIANEQAIISFNWSPNFVEAAYDGKFVEFPPFEAGCIDDPAWGSNPDLLYDCANPVGAYLKIAAWAGFAEKWPNAYAALAQIDFTNADIALMAKLVDVDGLTGEGAGQKWLDDNAGVWGAWVG